jgi:hypothetical protein
MDFLTGFTYITGIAGLLGLFLQVKDSFPEHREARKTIVLLVIGVFLGAAISLLTGVKLILTAEIGAFQVLVAAIVLVLAFISLAAAFAGNAERRNALFGFAGVGTIALLFILMFGSLTSGTTYHQVAIEKERISIDELMLLIGAAESRSDYERALMYLELAESRLEAGDVRSKVLEQRASGMRQKQVESR